MSFCARQETGGAQQFDKKGNAPMPETIQSRENVRVKRACALRDSAARRREEGLFFAEGLRLCMDLAERIAPAEVYYTQRLLQQHPQAAQLAGQGFLISEAVAEKLSDTRAPQGLFALFPRKTAALSALRRGGRYLCLEHVQDPANVGALLRSAAAFGFEGAVLCGACADPFAPKAARASMGSLARLSLLFAEETKQAIDAFHACGIPVVAAALRNSVPLDAADAACPDGVALFIGNEGNGLAPQTVAAADQAVRIPMANGVESLNAAAAGSVLLWHFRGV